MLQKISQADTDLIKLMKEQSDALKAHDESMPGADADRLLNMADDLQEQAEKKAAELEKYIGEYNYYRQLEREDELLRIKYPSPYCMI